MAYIDYNKKLPESLVPLETNKKFDTCKYRTEGLEKKVISSCCGKPKEIEGYKCNHFGYFPLDPKFCANCEMYEKR